jgi:hypothetical protein
MPWLPLYLFDDDPDVLLAMLNDDPEAAFIVSGGIGRWKAVETLPTLAGKRHAIWHVPSGPLPLLAAVHGDPDSEITDPWRGWTERRASADPTTPYFGAGHPGIFWLNLKNQSQSNERTIGLSSFEWIGHRYAMLGQVVQPSTDKWWKKLSRSVRRSASKLPRGGPNGAFKPEIYALPGAVRAFAEGKEADDNP